MSDFSFLRSYFGGSIRGAQLGDWTQSVYSLKPDLSERRYCVNLCPMLNAPIPVTESERLEALKRYEILNTASEEVFDELTRLAAAILKAPLSSISIVEESKSWIKSGVGMPFGQESSRDLAFCAHTVAQNEMLVIPDLREDDRFKDHPMTGEGGVRFYAGQPLRTPDGQNIGTLCVLDQKPRQFSKEDRETLRILGKQVMSQMELRRSLKELTSMNRKALALESILRRYTSKSIWERADVSATQGNVSIKDEQRDHACLFIDVVGFTRYAENHSAEQVVQILNDYFGPIVHKIHEAGGDVDKFVGDQVFAIFDTAEDGIRASLSVRNCVESLNAERKNKSLATLEFRMGLNDGPVVRGNVGGDARSDNTLIGDMVNVASRLQSVCEPGEILASQSVTKSMNGYAKIKKTVKLKLKGKEEPVLAYYIGS